MKLNQSQRRTDALIAAGIAGSTFGHRRATTTHRDRRYDAKCGKFKHRERGFE